MATREEWTRLINLSHDMALVEDDLRAIVDEPFVGSAPGDNDYQAGEVNLARTVLYERFGVDV